MSDPTELLKGTTPGPWALHPPGLVVGAGLETVVLVDLLNPDNDSEMCKANARLIAAAPELARELAEVRRQLDLLFEETRCSHLPGDPECKRRRALEAKPSGGSE